MIRKLASLCLLIVQKIKDYLNDFVIKGKITCGKQSFFFASAVVNNMQRDRNSITIGKYSSIRGELMVFKHAGKIVIGDYCYLGEHSKIWSASEIKIGDRVLIAHNVNIHDNNSHPIDNVLRHEHYKNIISSGHPASDIDLCGAPVIIEDDVWLGFNSTILKGVKIGRGSVIGANTLVTEDIPPFSLVVGNPFRIVRNLK